MSSRGCRVHKTDFPDAFVRRRFRCVAAKWRASGVVDFPHRPGAVFLLASGVAGRTVRQLAVPAPSGVVPAATAEETT